MACARSGLRTAVAAILVTGLTGCGSISERTAAAAFTSPGKYNVYTCDDVERTMMALRVRQVELEQLMARASQGVGGEFVNTIAYRGEYAQGRGDLIELAKAKADKQCAAESKFSSGRAVFDQPNRLRASAAPRPSASSLAAAMSRRIGAMPQLVPGTILSLATYFAASAITAATCAGASPPRRWRRR